MVLQREGRNQANVGTPGDAPARQLRMKQKASLGAQEIGQRRWRWGNSAGAARRHQSGPQLLLLDCAWPAWPALIAGRVAAQRNAQQMP